jgi:hypothetical protein
MSSCQKWEAESLLPNSGNPGRNSNRFLYRAIQMTLPYWLILSPTNEPLDATKVARAREEETCANFQYFTAQLL